MFLKFLMIPLIASGIFLTSGCQLVGEYTYTDDDGVQWKIVKTPTGLSTEKVNTDEEVDNEADE